MSEPTVEEIQAIAKMLDEKDIPVGGRRMRFFDKEIGQLVEVDIDTGERQILLYDDEDIPD